MPWTKINPDPTQHAGLEGDASCERWLDYADAIREALDQALSIDSRVFIMGQDVDEGGCMFGTTKGLTEKHGAERCVDTPLAESALMGVAVGAAIGGMRPVYMHNRPDFFYLCLDQLVNHASKWHYMFGGAVNVPLVVWACIGKGWGSGAQHSQTLEGVMMQFPGLKFVMPCTAYDAKGLLLAAIADPNPVVIIDHRHNFKFKARVPEHPYQVPIGKGVVRREGTDVSIIALSNMVIESLKAADTLAEQGIDAEVIDLRSLRPIDEALIVETVRKTGRLVVADTGWRRGGASAEVMAIVAEQAHDALKAPARRVTCPDVPTPSGYTLERGFYRDMTHIVEAARDVVG